jgi:hypothetical protein
MGSVHMYILNFQYFVYKIWIHKACKFVYISGNLRVGLEIIYLCMHDTYTTLYCLLHSNKHNFTPLSYSYWLKCLFFLQIAFSSQFWWCVCFWTVFTQRNKISNTYFLFILTWVNVIHGRTVSTWKSSHLEKVWEQQRRWACRAVEMSKSTQGKLYYVLGQDILQRTVCELDSVQTCCEWVPTNIKTLYDYALLACDAIQFGRYLPKLYFYPENGGSKFP